MAKCGKCGDPAASVEQIRTCYSTPDPLLGGVPAWMVEDAQRRTGRMSTIGPEPKEPQLRDVFRPDENTVIVNDLPRPVQITEGYWKLGETFYKVQRSQSNGYLYAKRFATMGNTALGWVFLKGGTNLLRYGNATPLTEEDAAAFGKLYGVCVICGRTLTNEESIERGIGPICAGKQGW